MQLVKAAIEVNEQQRNWVIKKLQSLLHVIRCSTIGVLGLSFKPNTDDLRGAPSVDIIRKLIDLGAHVKAYDPVAMDNFQRHHSELPVEFARNVEALFKDSDAVVLLTEWEIFKYLPYATLGELMKQKILLDGRNALDAQALQRAGYIYRGVGR